MYREEKPVSLTRHADIRCKDRLGLNKRSKQRNVELARRNGLTIRDVSGKMKNVFLMCICKNPGATDVRIYNRYIYVFNDNILVTVMPLKKEFYRLEDKFKAELRGKTAKRRAKPFTDPLEEEFWPEPEDDDMLADAN